MKKLVYHLGIYKDKKTVVLQAVPNVDSLNCEIIEYFGPRETTKENLKRNKNILLKEFKKQFNYLKDCDKIRVE